MKIRSNLHAGDALRECQKQRDYWRNRAEDMQRIATGPGPVVQPQPLPQPLPQPPTTPGGGWVGGSFYYDRSGWCG